MAASMARTWLSWTSSRTWVPAWVRPMPMWCRRPARRRVTQPVESIRSVRTRFDDAGLSGEEYHRRYTAALRREVPAVLDGVPPG